MSIELSVLRPSWPRALKGLGAVPVVAVLGAPVAGLAYLLRHPAADIAIQASVAHFYIVASVSLIGVLISAAMTAGSRRLRDARAFFLNAGFLAISGIFLIHALTTPGVMMGMNAAVGLAARLSLFVGSVAFAMSVVRWNGRVNAWVAGHWRILMLVLLAMGMVFGAMTVLPPHDPMPFSGHGLHAMASYPAAPPSAASALLGSSGLMAVAAIGLFGFAAAGYLHEYRVSALPAQGTLVAGIVLLAEAQLAMWLSPTWALSWWGYHLLMLAGFLTALIGFARAYTRRHSLAGVVDTLFLTDTIERIETSYSESIFALVAAVEARDRYTQGHSARVSQMSVLIGEALRLPGEQLRSLGRGGLVHDVGKLGLPDAILSKPGRLTPKEYEIVKQHPVRGYEIIRRVASLRDELPVVLYHHEWYNGRGYPEGLAGDAIPLHARIMAVADVYDALTSARPYREALTEDAAMAHLRRMAGVQFDPRAVEAFAKIQPQWSERGRRLGQ